MTAKEYLGQAYRIDQRINSKLEQVQSLRALATKATSTLTELPPNGTRNVHSMEDIIAKIIGLEAEINRDIDQLVDTKREIIAVIKRIPSPEHQTLLELRYISCKTWEEISTTMYYSVRNIHILHGSALREVEKIYPAS